MNVILGVTVCLFCFLSFSLVASFITVRLTTMVGRKRNLTLILSSSLCFLLLSLLCSLVWPKQVALADESELPSNFEQVALTRSSPDEIVVTEGDKARLVNVAKSGSSESSDTSELWEKALDALLVGPCTQAEATARIMDDLAWRYYHYPDKREKVPVVPGGEFGQGDRFQPLNHYSNYGEFLQKNRMVYDTSAFIFYYHLVELNSGKSWNSGTWNYEDLYRDWYNYYEGITDTPSNENQEGPYTFPITMTGIKGNWGATNATNGTPVEDTTVTLDVNSESIATNINNKVGNAFSIILFVSAFSNNSGSTGTTAIYLLVSESPINVTIADNGVQPNGNNTPVYSIQYSSESTVSTYRYSAYTSTRENNKIYSYQSNILNYNGHIRAVYSSQSIGTGNQNPTEPVYSPPIDKPTSPDVPTPAPVNTPTSPNITNVNVTQTDVDLQPVIDAISVLNTNMVNHFNGLETFMGDWFSALFDMLTDWRDMWIEYTGALYEDLTDYLWNIERLLNQLLLQETSEPVVNPTIDDGNTADQQATVNLELLKKKFPTSIPWDLYGILTLLETAPVAPTFTLPVVMTEYTITIDLSDFSPMAAVSRRMSVLLFAVGLLMNTKKIASIDIGANHGN